MSSEEFETPARRLRRKIVLYAVLYTLVALLLVSLIGMIPLTHQLREDAKKSLLQEALIRSHAVEEHLLLLQEVARQVASRSVIRFQLAAYVRGEITLQDLRTFTEPKLRDSLESSGLLASVTRLGPSGEVVAQAGVPFPRSQWPPIVSETTISDPIVIGQDLYVAIAVPILSAGRHIGTDLALFSAATLQRIVWEKHEMGTNAITMLAYMDGDEARLFFPVRTADREVYNAVLRNPVYVQALLRTQSNLTGTIEHAGNGEETADIIAYTPVEGTGWGILSTVDQESLYATIDKLIISEILITLFLALCGGAGIFFLLRPLTHQSLLYARRLENLNRELQREVEERQRAEEEVRRSEQEWAQTFEAITDAVAILDTQGRVLKMNRANQSFISSISEEVFGKRHCHTKKADPAKDLCPFPRMLETRTPESMELYEPKNDRFYQISVYPLFTEEGHIWGGVHIASDITEQKKMEAMKDEMISSVSHEMRTPLTAMLGFVEYLLENEVDPDQQKDFLRTVHRETERLNELISNFLDLQRLQAQLEHYSFEDLEIYPLLKEAADLFQVASRKHKVYLECPETLPPVKGDPKRLQQVLKNLITNAIRYSPDGGDIHVGAREDATGVVLWVRDEGMGIPPYAQKKIFGRFYRVDDSSRRIPGGIGLGLALVQEVVHAHGGRVWVQSTMGKGSTFYFTLPRADQGAEAGSSQGQP